MALVRSHAQSMRNRVIFLALSAILFGLWSVPFSGFAQTPEKALTKPGKEGPEPGKKVALPGSEEEIDKEIARLQTLLPELRSRTILSINGAGSETAPGLGVALPEESAAWQRMNLEFLYLLENQVKSLQDLKEIRKTNRERAAERKEWRGFPEKPPFPASFVEGLYDAINARQFEQQVREVRLKVVEGQLREYVKKLEDAGKEIRSAEERRAEGKEKETDGRAMWLRDLARLRYELAEEGVLSSEIQRLVLEEDLVGRREYLPFLEHQYRLAEAVSPLSKADLDQKLKELETLKISLNDRLSRALREEEAANQALEQARSSLHAAQTDVPSGQAPSPFEQKRLDHLKSAQEAEKTRLSTIEMMVDTYKGMLRLHNVEQGFWEDRYRLGGNADPMDVAKRSGEIQQILEYIRFWKNSLRDGMDKLAPLLNSQQEKLSAGGLSKEEEQVARSFSSAYVDREILYRQTLKELSRMERVTERWEDDLNALGERMSKNIDVVGRLKSLSSPFLKIWNTELYVAEESTIVEGQKISRPIGVTLGKVAKALLIFLVGIWAARLLRNPMERFAARRFRLDENAARQAGRKWSFFTFIGLFAIALSSLNIPLAVFAFFGGTLAIAAGFGAQHLIGNFLSSVILLFDRTIQIGDVVEIDGHRGQVTNIGMRSSSILRFDGVEMLVPNSQFLEQRVTNWTHSHKRVRYEIPVGVAYQSSTKEVSDLILAVVEEDPHILKDPAPLVIFEEFGENALIFRVYVWLLLETEKANRIACSNIRHRIKAALDEAGIVIAFPQRDIHLEAKHPLPVEVVGHGHSEGIVHGSNWQPGK